MGRTFSSSPIYTRSSLSLKNWKLTTSLTVTSKLASLWNIFQCLEFLVWSYQTMGHSSLGRCTNRWWKSMESAISPVHHITPSPMDSSNKWSELWRDLCTSLHVSCTKLFSSTMLLGSDMPSPAELLLGHRIPSNMPIRTTGPKNDNWSCITNKATKYKWTIWSAKPTSSWTKSRCVLSRCSTENMVTCNDNRSWARTTLIYAWVWRYWKIITPESSFDPSTWSTPE